MRHTRRAPFWIGALASCTLLACAGAASGQPVDAESVATRPVQGQTRAEAARVFIVPQAHAAEGQLSLRLLLRGGGGDDPLGASGLSHLVSHAVWDSAMDRLDARAANGDARAAALLASMGGRQHAHRAATVDMRATTYRVDLAGASDQVVEDALALLAEIRAGRGLDDPDILGAALARVNEELRGWTSPYLRVNQQATRALFEPLGLAPGPFVGRLDELEALDARELAVMAHSAHWRGVPVVIAAGDTASLAEPRLGSKVIDAVPTPASIAMHFRNERVEPRSAPETVVIRDPEITFGVVELLRVDRHDPSDAATRWIASPDDDAGMRESLLRAGAAEALKRRLELATESMTGDDALSELVVMSKPFTDGVWLNVVHAMNAPGRWVHAMRVLATEIRRVETHGYSEGEARLALSKALRDYESAARGEHAETSAQSADRVAEMIRLGEPVRSPGERLLAARGAIAGAGAEALRDATSRAFGLREGITALAATSADDRGVTDRALLDLVRASRKSSPGALPAAQVTPASAESLLPRTASATSALSLRADPASGVLTATLANNLILHHRESAPQGGSVTIEITVSGGEIDEHPGVPRGITDAALSAWREAATATLSSREVRDALSGADLRVRAWSDHDIIRLSLRASRDDLETALALASALIREPRVETVNLERWRQSALERAAIARTQPFDALRSAMWADGVDSDDPRVRAPTEDDLRAITTELAQAWLDDLLARGSVEAAIVGDVSRADAMHLGARLLGATPVRPPVVAAPVRDDAPARGTRPMRTTLDLDTLAPHAAALVGFVTDAGGAQQDAFSWAVMDLASRVLSPRVREALSGDLAIANEARSLFMPVAGWRGFSLCYTPILASPDRLDGVVAAAEGVYASVAADGVSDAEFERARAAAARSLDAELLDPNAWAGALSAATRRAQPVDLLQRRRDALALVDPASVQREIADRLEGGDAVRVIVRPRAHAQTR